MPLNNDQVGLVALHDRSQIFMNQEQLDGPLTLERAMAMALKYNLENRVRLLEEAVSYDAFELAKTDMLPTLAANAGYTTRNTPNASFSNSINSGSQSLEPSTSQDDEQKTGDFGFSWNLLDFGVSYLQAKQDADRFLMAQKAREKVMLTLLQEVRSAYWNALAMEAMRAELDQISAEVDTMLGNLETVRREQLRTPIAVLLDIRALIETRQQLDQIRNSISNAETRLATLVNVPSYSNLELVVPDVLPELEQISADVESMEMLALANSADYSTEIYKVRIEQLETRKTMLRLLPGLEFSYTDNYGSNSFLVNNQWAQMGSNLTADIGRLFFVNRIDKYREVSEQLSINRKLAVNMAVIAGVHINWQDYQNAQQNLERAELLNQIDAEISFLTTAAQQSQAGSGVETIQNSLRAFRSKISSFQSYADAQSTYGSLLVALGLNPIPPNYQSFSVDELAQNLTERMDRMINPLREGSDLQLADIIWPDVVPGEQQVLLAANEEPSLAGFLESFLTRKLDVPGPGLKAYVDEFLIQPAKTNRPDAERFMADFLPHILPSPSLPTYLEDFFVISPNSASPERGGYLDDLLPNIIPPPGVTDYNEDFSIEDGRGQSPAAESFLTEILPGIIPKPAAHRYLTDFLDKFSSLPDMEDYLDQFIERIATTPEPDSKAYLAPFKRRIPDSAKPNAGGYLDQFLDQFMDSSLPDASNYLQDFLDRFADSPGPDAGGYLQEFLDRFVESPKPDSTSYQQEFLDQLSKQPAPEPVTPVPGPESAPPVQETYLDEYLKELEVPEKQETKRYSEDYLDRMIDKPDVDRYIEDFRKKQNSE